MEEEVLNQLYQIITPDKKEKFDRIASLRTRYLTVVVENLFQEHNASAITRSCDCFGVQDLHIIEKNNHFSLNDYIAKGAEKWVNHYHYSAPLRPTTKCLQELKKKGYKIAATTPHTKAYTINNVPIDEPLALLFGTEKLGLTEKAIDMADYLVEIPMSGFTESLNVSISAALSMNTLRNRLLSTDKKWLLNKEEQIALKIQWCKKIINNGENVVKEIESRLLEKKRSLS